MGDERLADLRRFYQVLGHLEERLGGARMLASCNGRLPWPRRGVYFFMGDGENRHDSGKGNRIVRVGTHALKPGSSSTLWGQLSQHRGHARSGGGNHRGSIFRLLVGAAIISRQNYVYPSWGTGSTASHDVRGAEAPLESEVSAIIGRMRVIWLEINDVAEPDSERGYIERNAIALLSNYKRRALDPPSATWLGRSCDRVRVRESGLWNSCHVDEAYDRDFLERLEHYISQI